MSSVQWKIKLKIGVVYLVASKKGLQGIFWDEQSSPMLKTLKSKDPKTLIIKQAVEQLEEYFKGERKVFDVPVDVQGTDFQKQVWRALAQIPYGTTTSYKKIAVKIKNDKAVRAVGSANGKNPLSIIVPCHRVIASDGSIGGYAGGLKIKEILLKLEIENSLR